MMNDNNIANSSKSTTTTTMMTANTTGAIMEGPLNKWTNMLHGWQFRWFVLDQQNGLLSYYTSKENMNKGERRGCIRLKDSVAYVGYDNEDDITFTITVDEKTFHLQARNLNERQKWINKIDRTIRLHSSVAAAAAAAASASNETFDLEKFDSSLVESDAYLQILIEQLKGLELKRQKLLEKNNNSITPSGSLSHQTDNESSTSASSSNGRKVHSEEADTTLLESADSENEHYTSDDDQKFQSIIKATESLIETLKHAIICLQIAKANADPKNNLDVTNDLNQAIQNFNRPQALTQVSNITSDSRRLTVPGDDSQTKMSSSTGSINNQTQATGANGSVANKNNLVESSKGEKISTNEEKSTTKTTSSKRKGHLMPIASYSSSDNEDDENEIKAPSADQPEATSPSSSLKTTKKLSKNLIDNVEDDEDELSSNRKDDYEDDDDDMSDYYEDEAALMDAMLKKQPTDDNDSESFYDAIDLTYNNNMINASDQYTNLVSSAATSSLGVEHEIVNVNTDQENVPRESAQATHANDTFHNNLNANNCIIIDNKYVTDIELYDDDASPEEIDLNNQQSVITHLLTQVRIGMDLTKITLPTFILEPRSLLEMYADFFAHTDLFLEIVDKKNPHERMVQVVKWYLSTFHAGRKSPVAKKPYNPILGETFQCWYDLNDKLPSQSEPSQAMNSDTEKIGSGPVTWANKNQLTFIAEQVSHHPPISAFYAEHFNKRIQVDGYTWTKSKFLGLSIGVHFVGKAVLSLLDYDEEYILTFPSAYGRSILTVPWFEMGGAVSINCPKTGYCSNIEFLTKPFYGGKKHQIQGTIFGPDKKPLYTLDGDWNGTMFIKSGKRQDILISTQSTPTIKKKVRPLIEQSENESRNLWKEVTYYLRTKQIDQATAAKQNLEQLQRNQAKSRKETNTKWKPEHFVEDGENWIYINPLVKRIQPK